MSYQVLEEHFAYAESSNTFGCMKGPAHCVRIMIFQHIRWFIVLHFVIQTSCLEFYYTHLIRLLLSSDLTRDAERVIVSV